MGVVYKRVAPIAETTERTYIRGHIRVDIIPFSLKFEIFIILYHSLTRPHVHSNPANVWLDYLRQIGYWPINEPIYNMNQCWRISIGLLETNFNEIRIEILPSSFKKMSSAKMAAI